MKLLIDMNLSPDWEAYLLQHGHDAIHWSRVGNSNDPDSEILSKAKSEGWTLMTHDLDFGAILAATDWNSPSVLQVRTQDVSPDVLGPTVLQAITQFADAIAAGALVSIDENAARVRVLPIGR